MKPRRPHEVYAEDRARVLAYLDRHADHGPRVDCHWPDIGMDADRLDTTLALLAREGILVARFSWRGSVVDYFVVARLDEYERQRLGLPPLPTTPQAPRFDPRFSSVKRLHHLAMHAPAPPALELSLPPWRRWRGRRRPMSELARGLNWQERDATLRQLRRKES